VKPSLYTGRVVHTRLKPVRHRLSYRVFMGLFDVDRLDLADRDVALFGYNRPNLIAFYDKDHGDGSGLPLRAQIMKPLSEAGIAIDGAIFVLCMPRILGWVFNPLSVYFCCDENERLRAIIHEVTNMHGERHFYVLSVGEGDGRRVSQHCGKSFRVSPLLQMQMSYDFDIIIPRDRALIHITASDAEGPLLVASFLGVQNDFNSGSILRAWLTHPALTWKVVAGIYWEALATFMKLKWKEVRVRS
jgi:Uncharacterized conserved protein